jgi:hypothetical protein
MTEEKQEHNNLLRPKSGTATSSPIEITTSPTLKGISITNVLLWMKRNAYAATTITATGKRLRHLEANTDLTQPEKVKAHIANKECSNGFKETLIET